MLSVELTAAASIYSADPLCLFAFFIRRTVKGERDGKDRQETEREVCQGQVWIKITKYEDRKING